MAVIPILCGLRVATAALIPDKAAKSKVMANWWTSAFSSNELV